jgi:CHASE2 domain-containing sensor protein
LIGAVCAGAAILIAGAATRTQLGGMLENRLVDARFAMLPSRPPNPNVMVVVLDDATLKQDSRLLGERQVDFARMIETIFGAGARAVAIDILLPETWSQSHEFTAAVLGHAEHLALAKFSTSGEVIGTECISQLTAWAIGPRFQGMFGFVNLDKDKDGDGRTRRSQITYRDREGRPQQSFAASAVRAASMNVAAFPAPDRLVWIDYQGRPAAIPTISWKDVPGQLQTAPDLFRNRLVFIGVEFAGSNDEVKVPESVSPDVVSGVRIQALITNTILAGFPVRDPGLLPSLFAMGVAGLGTLALALRFPHHPMAALMVAGGCFCGYAAFSFAIFRSSRIMIPVIGPELCIVLSAAAAWCLKMWMKPYPLAKGG